MRDSRTPPTDSPPGAGTGASPSPPATFRQESSWIASPPKPLPEASLNGLCQRQHLPQPRRQDNEAEHRRPAAHPPPPGFHLQVGPTRGELGQDPSPEAATKTPNEEQETPDLSSADRPDEEEGPHNRLKVTGHRRRTDSAKDHLKRHRDQGRRKKKKSMVSFQMSLAMKMIFLICLICQSLPHHRFRR